MIIRIYYFHPNLICIFIITNITKTIGQWFVQYKLTSTANSNTKSFITLALTMFLSVAVVINEWNIIETTSWSNDYVAYRPSTNSNNIVADWVILGIV